MKSLQRLSCRRRVMLLLFGQRSRGGLLLCCVLVLVVWLHSARHSFRPERPQIPVKHVLSARADGHALILVIDDDEDDVYDDDDDVEDDDGYNTTSRPSSAVTPHETAGMWPRRISDARVADSDGYDQTSSTVTTLPEGDDVTPEVSVKANMDGVASPFEVRQSGDVRRGRYSSTDDNISMGQKDMAVKMSIAEDWSATQKNRKRLIRKTCEESRFFSKKRIYDTPVIVDKGTDLLYCPVEKVASTFMRRFMCSLRQIDSARSVRSPFDVPVDVALTYEFDTLRTLFYEGITDFVDSSTKVLFVRDPYSRLFAAYVDKLLVPNSYYWKKWAAPAIAAYRNTPSAQALHCGHDVSFTEFVKYAVDSLHSTDPHLRPVSRTCAPCEMDYTVIGHLETFADDFAHLTRILEISVANCTSETMAAEFAIDAIVDYTYSAFESLDDLRGCVTKLEMAQRLWSAMQVKGIISSELRFSLTEEDMATLTPSRFVKCLDRARRSWSDAALLLRQKQDAMEEAFRQVPDSVMLQITGVYSLDFQMFGYDKYPRYRTWS